MKDILLAREASLITTLDHLQEQYDWANQSGYYDLREAYTAGQQVILAKLGEVQALIKLCNEEK